MWRLKKLQTSIDDFVNSVIQIFFNASLKSLEDDPKKLPKIQNFPNRKELVLQTANYVSKKMRDRYNDLIMKYIDLYN